MRLAVVERGVQHATASFFAMLISSKMQKPPYCAASATGPRRSRTSPPVKVSVPISVLLSVFTWNDTV